MNPEVFAEWLRRQGHQVYRTESSYWFKQGLRVLQAFPYHWLIEPNESEINDLLKRTRSLSLRYSTGMHSPNGKISYHVIFEQNGFSFSAFSKKVRHDIKHGLDYCQYQPISFSLLSEQGWDLRNQTLHRQGRAGAENKKWWSSLCMSADGLPGFEAWGALREGQLLASIFTFIDDGYASILYQQSSTDHLKHGINNALIYSYVNHILSEKRAEKIFYGLHSLDAPASVDEFKFRMGFYPKPVRQRVVFHPAVAPFINPPSYSMLVSLKKLFTNNYFLAKAEGMFRFYLEGKKEPAKQNWPEALLPYRPTVLEQALK